MKILMTCVAVSVLSGAAFATTWTVDDDGKADFDRIQDAVDAASSGDEIIVMPGTYAEEGIWPEYGIIISNKDIYLHSSDGPATTIIDGENTRRCMLFYEGVTSATTVEGFTFQNGYGGGSLGMGGAMYVYLASPNITNCIFQNNYSPGLGDDGGGGAVSMRYCHSPTIFTNCVFSGNVSESVGGALSARYFSSAASLIDCTFCENEPDTSIINGPWNDLGGNEFFESCFESTQIQWRIEDGGNGHWYQAVSAPIGISWLDANTAAGEMGGYLATLTSAEEDGFVCFTIAEHEALWIMKGTPRGPWLGGQRTENDCDLQAMNWVTGEPWDYTRWHSGNPNEDCTSGLQLWDYGVRDWQDNHDDDPTRANGFIVEFTTLPGSALGACCLDGLCITTAAADCSGNSGSWGGPNSSCADFDCQANCPSDINGNGQVDIDDLLALISAFGICP